MVASAFAGFGDCCLGRLSEVTLWTTFFLSIAATLIGVTLLVRIRLQRFSTPSTLL